MMKKDRSSCSTYKVLSPKNRCINESERSAKEYGLYVKPLKATRLSDPHKNWTEITTFFDFRPLIYSQSGVIRKLQIEQKIESERKFLLYEQEHEETTKIRVNNAKWLVKEIQKEDQKIVHLKEQLSTIEYQLEKAKNNAKIQYLQETKTNLQTQIQLMEKDVLLRRHEIKLIQKEQTDSENILHDLTIKKYLESNPIQHTVKAVPDEDQQELERVLLKWLDRVIKRALIQEKTIFSIVEEQLYADSEKIQYVFKVLQDSDIMRNAWNQMIILNRDNPYFSISFESLSWNEIRDDPNFQLAWYQFIHSQLFNQLIDDNSSQIPARGAATKFTELLHNYHSFQTLTRTANEPYVVSSDSIRTLYPKMDVQDTNEIITLCTNIAYQLIDEYIMAQSEVFILDGQYHYSDETNMSDVIKNDLILSGMLFYK